MTKPSLRVFTGSSHDEQAESRDPYDRQLRELDRITGIAEPKMVSLPLGKIVPLLIDAAANDRAWLNDFAEDTVSINADLYDVLLAYQQLRERSAA